MRKKISFNAEEEDLRDLLWIMRNVRLVQNQTDAIRYALKFTAEALGISRANGAGTPDHAHKQTEE